jgi:hypothetical protein
LKNNNQSQKTVGGDDLSEENIAEEATVEVAKGESTYGEKHAKKNGHARLLQLMMILSLYLLQYGMTSNLSLQQTWRWLHTSALQTLIYQA